MGTLGMIGWMVVAALGYMTAVWGISLVVRNASIVDSFWGPGFIVLAVAAPWVADAWTWRSVLVLALVTVWGLRLAMHVTVRNWGKGEDWRYRQWREEAPDRFWWTSYFRVFVLQGILMVVVAAPILATAASSRAGWTGLDVAGAFLWLFGLSYEAIADLQLMRFKRDPTNKGRVFDQGLWRTSRHPNYFGESMVWWGLFLVALSVPEGIWSIIGPVAITFLLLRVSGVRMLERGLKHRKPAYAEYIRRTSPFIPWPPRRAGSGE